MYNYFMPHISRKKLEKDISRKIYKHFVKTIVTINTKKGRELLEEILTPVEQIMIAKRLAAIAMLSQGLSSYQVRKSLKLSSATTARFRREIENNKYPYISNLVKKKKQREEFWKEMEVVLRMGMPSMGKDRWKWLDDLYPKK